MRKLLIAFLGAFLCVNNVFAGTPSELPHVEAKKMWVRATVGDMRTVAAYGILTNKMGEDDALVKVSTPFAEMVHIHRTTVDDSGYMQMDMQKEVYLPKGHFVQLAPGDLHIMLMRVKKALEPGDEIPLTLEFKNAPKVNVRATVYPVGATWNDVK